jgi:hypothetical protein
MFSLFFQQSQGKIHVKAHSNGFLFSVTLTEKKPPAKSRHVHGVCFGYEVCSKQTLQPITA